MPLTSGKTVHLPGTLPGATAERLEIVLPPLRSTIKDATRLVVETILVPTLLFALLLKHTGLLPALLASLGWCYAVLAVRWIAGRRLPGTLVLSSCMFTARTGIALATSSAFIYLLQPVVGSLVMAVLFIGSAFIGTPVTQRLARDFIHLPAHLLGRRRIRRMFRDVAILFGLSRAVSAVVSLHLIQHGDSAGLMSRGVVGPALTVVTIAACFFLGWRHLHKDGITLRRHCAPLALPAGS